MASKITIPDLKKIRVTDPLFSHYADMVAKKMIPCSGRSSTASKARAAASALIISASPAARSRASTAVSCSVIPMPINGLRLLPIAQITAKRSTSPRRMSSSRSSGRPQQPDGYLNTYFTVCHPRAPLEEPHRGPRALQRGHLIEAAVAYYNATGKRRLLDIAARFADLICGTFGRRRGPASGLSRPSGDRACAREALARDGRGALPEDGSLLH